MVTIISHRIADLIADGKTLEQVKARRAHMDYDGRYGAPLPSWNKDLFIEAVYTELVRRRNSLWFPVKRTPKMQTKRTSLKLAVSLVFGRARESLRSECLRLPMPALSVQRKRH